MLAFVDGGRMNRLWGELYQEAMPFDLLDFAGLFVKDFRRFPSSGEILFCI